MPSASVLLNFLFHCYRARPAGTGRRSPYLCRICCLPQRTLYTLVSLFSTWQPGIYRRFYINLTPPDIKRQGLFSPCLFCKAVCILRIHKPDSVGPAGPGRHLAYDYYSILHLSLQETCIAFGGTPQTRPVILCTMLWYPAPGNRGFRPFSPIFREFGQITHSLSAGFMQLRPFPIPVYFCI